ncbi:MAG TPA: HEAT repeat domain-containing protein [Anaerolineales bacterium]|nr:HEAT repeat domain-containing protein [Anaerolineales bacterium]
MNASEIQSNAATIHSLDSLLQQWTSQIQGLQKQTNNKSTPAWLTLVATIVLGLAGLIALEEHSWIGFVILVAGIGISIVLFNQVSKFRKEATKKLAVEIQQTCQEEHLAKEAVVENLFEKTSGAVSTEVLQVVEPDTFALLQLHKREEEFFENAASHKINPVEFTVSSSNGSVTAVTLQGEQDVDRFSEIAVECLAHKGYVEGMAALAMVQMLYTEIAPPGGEFFVNTRSGSQGMKDVGLNALKIVRSFDFKPEMKSIKENVTKRQTQSIVEMLVLAQQQQISLDDGTLAAALDKNRLKVRDERFVGACIDYLGKQTSAMFTRMAAYEVLALIPDERTLPYLMEAFGQMAFFPQGIEALAFLGERTHQKLIDAMQTGHGSLRFNAAMALGFMNATAAKPTLEAVLLTTNDPTEQVGLCYALVRLGENQHLSAIVDTLNHSNADVRHIAAIALEHLSEKLDSAVFLGHLEDSNRLVRLRLTRKIGAQGTEDPALIDALAKRFDDGNEDVRAAAVTAMSSLKAELIYDQMVDLANKGTANARQCAYEVLGKLQRPEAVPLLSAALSKSFAKDLRRAAISSLGELGAVEMADKISPFLDDDDLSGAAFWALLRISLKDKEAGTKPLHKSKYHLKELFLLSLHGDAKAKTQFKAMLSPTTDLVQLVQSLEYAQILREAEFEIPLRQLLKYRNPSRFPADRYVSYMALKALANIQMAK